MKPRPMNDWTGLCIVFGDRERYNYDKEYYVQLSGEKLLEINTSDILELMAVDNVIYQGEAFGTVDIYGWLV